jgi:hypothetical protein
MAKENLHATDEELLRHADGETRPATESRIAAHLECCSPCRARLAELESTLAEVGAAQRSSWDAELPGAAGPRALLKMRLAELAAKDASHARSRSARVLFVEHGQAVALAGVVLAACLLIVIRLHGPVERSQSLSASLGHWEEPDLRLTPGATVPVTSGEVCGTTAAKALPGVPVSMKRKVFEEYGVTPPRPDAYEVDYLITPELGGATDIRNLWPEPYQDTVWNAHVKDQLEDRLHRMVCRGDVDLATAQRDLATDWIAAYRKYFHTDRPVVDDSSFDFSSLRPSLPRT